MYMVRILHPNLKFKLKKEKKSNVNTFSKLVKKKNVRFPEADITKEYLELKYCDSFKCHKK